MNGIQRMQRSERGSTLLNILCFLFIVIGLVGTILDTSNNHRKVSAEQVKVDQAMYVAEGGCEIASRFVQSNLYAMVMQNGNTTNGTGTIGSGTYNYYVTRLNTTAYSVVSTGTVNGVYRVVKINWLYQPTYAEFAFWAATNGAINFVEGNVFNGRVHTDDPPQFQSSGNSPSNGAIFNAVMDTLANSFVGSTNGSVFAQGFFENSFEGSMATVDFNSSAATSLKQLATNTGLALYGTSTITFNTTQLQITNPHMGWTNHVYSLTNATLVYVQSLSNGPANSLTGAVYLTGGILSGQLTIATENDVTIMSNITYSHDPAVYTNSTDALGIVSGGNIWISTNAPNNIVIDAAMMATGANPDGLAPLSPGSFEVVNYSSGSPRGNLTLYGGIVQYVRGAVGTDNNGTIATGYNKIYSYDPRFINNPPPDYPAVGGKFMYSGWAEGH